MMVRKTKPKEYLKQSVGFALDPENLRNIDQFIAEKDSLIASRNLLNPFPHACIEFTAYIEAKTKTNGGKGRDHFLLHLAKSNKDVQEEVFAIIEKAWIKNNSIYKIVRHYKKQGHRTSYHTIYRLLQDIEPFKEALINACMQTPWLARP